MPESCHQKFKFKKRIVLFHSIAFIASTNQRAKIFFFSHASWINQHVPSPPWATWLFFCTGGKHRHSAPPCPLPHECRNYTTWPTAIFIFKSTSSNHARLSWHSSISVSSIRTHVWSRECLTCMWNIGPYTCSLLPIPRHDPTHKLFNFHALKKKSTTHHFVIDDHHSFRLILLLNLSKSMPEEINECM